MKRLHAAFFERAEAVRNGDREGEGEGEGELA
jgi:hypothetical protein